MDILHKNDSKTQPNIWCWYRDCFLEASHSKQVKWLDRALHKVNIPRVSADANISATEQSDRDLGAPSVWGPPSGDMLLDFGDPLAPELTRWPTFRRDYRVNRRSTFFKSTEHCLGHAAGSQCLQWCVWAADAPLPPPPLLPSQTLSGFSLD